MANGAGGPIQDVPKAHIQVKGKHLAVVESFVDTIELSEDDFSIKDYTQFESLSKDIAALHNKYLSEDDAGGLIFRECYQFSFNNRDVAGPIQAPENAAARSKFVAQIKAAIEALPRSYTIRIQLPLVPSFGAVRHKIADDMFYVTDDHVFDIPKPDASRNSPGLIAAAMGVGAAAQKTLSTYLEFHVSGYATTSPDTYGTSAAISSAKQCSFILTLNNVLESEYYEKTVNSTIHDGSRANEVRLPHAVQRCFGKLSLNRLNLSVTDAESGNEHTTLLSGFKLRPPVSDEERNMAVGSQLQVAVKFFGFRSHPDFPSIAAAIEWYQDSLYSDNQTFSFMAACIGLEALIGSDDQIDEMSKRLGDRYAFMIGKGRSERERLVEQYRKVLKLRGKLVHAKAARLLGSDKDLWRTAQSMLLKAISHEIHEMYRRG